MNLLPQFGLFELITVAVLALVIVGPRDLPRMMRSAGKVARRARTLAAEFTAAFDQMAREAELEEMRKELDALKSENVFTETKNSLEEAIRPIEDAVRDEANELRDAATKPIGWTAGDIASAGSVDAVAADVDGTGASEDEPSPKSSQGPLATRPRV